MNKYFRLLQSLTTLLTIAIVLTGCAIQYFPTPEVIGNQGLVVGQVLTVDYLPGVHTPVINGKSYQFASSGGNILFALEPGQYTLDSFVGNVFDSHVGNTTYSKNYTYPVQRKFTIEAGKATNIGLILLQPQKSEPSQGQTAKYTIYLLDNNREMNTFLREIRPKLYASLLQKNPVLAPGNYFNGEQINSLRSYIASKQNVGAKAYLTGPVGTLARLIRNSAGGTTQYKVMETNTLADLSNCSSTSKIVACLISTSEYLVAIEDKVIRHSMPAGVFANSLLALNENWLIVVDNSMNIYSSLDSGQTWKKFDKAALPQPLEAKYGLAVPKHRFAFFMGKDGYYIFLKTDTSMNTTSEQDKWMVYGDYRTATMRKLNNAQRVWEISDLRETDSGMFLGPYGAGLSKSEIHFLPKSTVNWETREIPEPGCQRIAFLDNSGNRLQVLCTNIFDHKDKALESNNGGLKWSQIPQANSLFKK